MSYQILRTEKADNQLADIINYVAEDNCIEVAMILLDSIEKEIMKLSDFPYMGTMPRYSILKRQGYLTLLIKKYIAFYKVDEKSRTIIVYTIVDSRQEYLNLIL